MYQELSIIGLELLSTNQYANQDYDFFDCKVINVDKYKKYCIKNYGHKSWVKDIKINQTDLIPETSFKIMYDYCKEERSKKINRLLKNKQTL